MTIRIEPIDSYNTTKMENWMSDMAAKGLFFDHSAALSLFSFMPLAFFSKGKPERRRYHLEPNERAFSGATEEQKQIFRDNGWEYAGEARRNFAVYYKIEGTVDSGEEIYTDEYTEAGYLRKLRSRYTLIALCFVLLAVIFAVTAGSLLEWAAFALCAAEAVLFLLRNFRQRPGEKLLRLPELLLIAAIIVISIINILR